MLNYSHKARTPEVNDMVRPEKGGIDMFFGHHADELLYGIGYVIGRIILCAVGFATGYIGINVLIGVWRWFSGVFL